MKHVFGPVPSRRLGRSLGVDLLPFKTCSYDCIYCQLGRTTDKTINRFAWGNCDLIIKEIIQEINSKKVDIITFSGSGEPTLNENIGTLIERVREKTDIPVAVLTNGSLLFLDEVSRDIRKADLVIPSLDCGNDKSFQRINRPCKGLEFTDMVKGLASFQRSFKGDFWLEIMLVKGFNDSPGEIREIKSLVDQIKPDKVQLNTVSRPPAENYAAPVSSEKALEIAGIIDQKAEMIRDIELSPELLEEMEKNENRIAEMLKRRPCTVRQIASSLSIHENEVVKYLQILEKKSKIKTKNFGGELFYSWELQ